MVLISRKLMIPSYFKNLGDYTEGETVFISEYMKPVEFIVAKHNYQADLNGNGKTLLVRKDCLTLESWSYTNNDYVHSYLHTTMFPNYVSNLGANIPLIQIFYSSSLGLDMGFGLSTLSTRAFLLSATELGKSDTYANQEGEKLPIASVLQVAQHDGVAVEQWTRTPRVFDMTSAFLLNGSGQMNYCSVSEKKDVRPCFTLPETCKFWSDTNEFAGG